MRSAIRKHVWEVFAIAGVVVLGLAVGAYVLSNQRLRFPLIEEKPVRRDGRAVRRSGRHTRPGPDRGRGGRARRRHRRREARGRPRRRRAPARQQARGPPTRRRLGAAAREDGHEGHVRGGRSRRGRAPRGERAHPGREHAARHRPRRVPRRARLGHARLPQAADLGRRQGPRGARDGPARGAPPPRPAAPRPRARVDGGGRAPHEPAPADQPLRPPDDRARREGRGHRAARARVELHARRVRRRGVEPLGPRRAPSGHASPDRGDPRQGARPLRHDGPRLRGAPPAVPQARRGECFGAPVRRGGHADHPRRGAPVHALASALPA